MKNGLYPAAPIVIVDDADTFCDDLLPLEEQLRQQGLDHLLRCQDDAELPVRLAECPPSLVLLYLPEPIAGAARLQRLCADFPQLQVVVLSRVDQVAAAVYCMRHGAFDYLPLPDRDKRLLEVVKRALAGPDSPPPGVRQKPVETPALRRPEQFAGIVTRSDVLLAGFRYLESIADSSAPLLITGEAGVGKKLLARVAHQLSRPQQRMLEVDVAGLDDKALEAALFRKPAQSAAGGSLYLTDVARLPSSSQQGLVHVLQTRCLPHAAGQEQSDAAWDLRLLCATREDLWRLVREGEFHTDLNFRLRQHHIHIPPLRERRGDVRLLVEHFVSQMAAERGLQPLQVPDRLWPMLRDYGFPGNVAELQLMVRTAVSMSPAKTLNTDPIALHIAQSERLNRREAGVERDTRLRFPEQLPTLKAAAEMLLREALRRSNGNQSSAGKMLGITQQAVSKRLKGLTQDV